MAMTNHDMKAGMNAVVAELKTHGMDPMQWKSFGELDFQYLDSLGVDIVEASQWQQGFWANPRDGEEELYPEGHDKQGQPTGKVLKNKTNAERKGEFVAQWAFKKR